MSYTPYDIRWHFRKNYMKRNYGGAFYPQPRKLKRSALSQPMSSLTSAQREQIARQRVLAAMRRQSRMGNYRIGNFPEIKAVDFPVANTTFPTAGTIACLNLIQAGSSYFNRIGRKIELKSFTIRGNIFTNATTTAYTFARMILFYDRQTNGAFPAVADLIQTTDQTGANTTTSWSGINMNYRDRFLILRDMVFSMPSETDTAGSITAEGLADTSRENWVIKAHVKLKNLITQYRADSSPAVIGDIATGGLYLLFIGSTADKWGVAWEGRLRYGDN